MNGLEIKERLQSGKRVYGTCIVSTSPRWLDIVPGLGLDFVFIDTEHIPIDREQLSWMCHAYRGLNLAPIVRVPSTEAMQASMAIDAGAAGVIIPYVETPEQVAGLVGAVKYRPLKHGLLADLMSGEKTLDPEMKRYLENFNNGQLVIANIESQPALDALDDILAVEGLDCILIGPHDLSCNLGVPEQYDHPKFAAAVKTIFDKARRRGVGAGIHSWFGVEKEAEWIRAGANFMVHSFDLYLFAQTLKKELIELRSAVGDVSGEETEDLNITV